MIKMRTYCLVLRELQGFRIEPLQRVRICGRFGYVGLYQLCELGARVAGRMPELLTY